jgi:hypothetical protein
MVVTPQQRKIVMVLFTIGCIVGWVGFLYVGSQLFQNRASVFRIFSAYITILTGVVIFLGYRLLRILIQIKK